MTTDWQNWLDYLTDYNSNNLVAGIPDQQRRYT